MEFARVVEVAGAVRGRPAGCGDRVAFGNEVPIYGCSGTDAMEARWCRWEDAEAFFDYGKEIREALSAVGVDHEFVAEGCTDFLGEVVEGGGVFQKVEGCSCYICLALHIVSF